MKPYPRDRSDPAPGKDVTTMSLDACKADSRSCPFCLGEGLATVFNPRYTGQVIEVDPSDLSRPPKRVLMRTVAYCVCTAGRKVMVVHQVGAKDVYARMIDLHDIIEGRCPNWTEQDPTSGKLNIDEIPLPSLRRLLAERMRV